MIPCSKMDHRIRPVERNRQPVPGTYIDAMQWNIFRTACDPRFDSSCHLVPCLRQCRDDVGSEKTSTARYDNPQFVAAPLAKPATYFDVWTNSDTFRRYLSVSIGRFV